jgi:hypothetical protein
LVYLLVHPNLVYRIFLAIDRPSSSTPMEIFCYMRCNPTVVYNRSLA